MLSSIKEFIVVSVLYFYEHSIYVLLKFIHLYVKAGIESNKKCHICHFRVYVYRLYLMIEKMVKTLDVWLLNSFCSNETINSQSTVKLWNNFFNLLSKNRSSNNLKEQKTSLATSVILPSIIFAHCFWLNDFYR